MINGKDQRVYWNILEAQAESIPNKPFLQFKSETARTYKEVYDAAKSIAAGLSSIGIAKGDCVLVMLENCIEYVLLSFALNRLGATEVPINTSYKGSFITHIANNSEAKVMIISRRYLERVHLIESDLSYLETLVLFGDEEKMGSPKLKYVTYDYKDIEKFHGDPPSVELCASDIATIIYTGGTTGPSKGVLIPNAYQHFHSHMFNEALRLTGEDIYYVNLPLFHANAKYVQVGCMLLCGGKAILAGKFSASNWLNDIRKYKCTATNTLGVMLEFINRQPEKDDDWDSPLRVMLSAPRPPQLAEEFEQRFKVRLVEVFGQTEIAGVLFSPYEGGRLRVNSKYFDVKIVDSKTDRELQPNQPGELIARPKEPWIMMQGYKCMPEKTVEVWRNLWYHTGDSLSVDEEGNFSFVDRLKDYIRRRGENISSQEVENVANQHPEVIESAVIGVKTGLQGGEDEVMIYVTLTEGSRLQPEQLMDFCNLRLPYFAVPRYVEFMPELPKNALKRVEKYKLKERGLSASTWDAEKVGYKVEKE